MIAEYSVNLENRTKQELITMIEDAQEIMAKQQKEINRLQNIKRKDIQDLINNENENIYKNYISKDRIRKDLETCEKVYKEEMKPYQREYGLDVTYLSKKEKEKLINTRNCLIAQMETYKQLLEDK